MLRAGIGLWQAGSTGLVIDDSDPHAALVELRGEHRSEVRLVFYENLRVLQRA